MRHYQSQFGHLRRDRATDCLLFLIGCFSKTHITLIGSLGISEVFILLFAPIIFIRNVNLFRREKVMTLINLAFFWFVGAFISDLAIGSPFPVAIRGIAHPLMLLSSIICIYPLLRKDLDGLKWIILGFAFSEIISIFAFQSHLSGGIEAGSAEAIDKVVGYKLFWVGKATAIGELPIKGWYFEMPGIYSKFVPLGLATFALASGARSEFLAQMVSWILLMMGGKNIRRIQNMGRRTVYLLLALMVLGPVAKTIYKTAAKSGWMGESEEKKLEVQTKTGDSALKLIMSGRSDFFVSLLAALDRPILGWGSHAIDYNDYYADFLRRFGDAEDAQKYELQLQMSNGVHFLPMHSHVTGFWAWHGIMGLVFWLYALWLITATLMKRIGVYPPYFGYLALVIPIMVWHILFSPFGLRTDKALLLVVCVIVRNIQQRRILV